MGNEKQKLRVFLCHASVDKPKVRELYRYLRRRGIKPWLDAEDLVPGQAWQVEIPRALNASDAIIICLTKNSLDQEGYVQKEIKFALDRALEMPEGRIFLIPARFEDCEVPHSLVNYQWVDLFEANGYVKLMKALRLRASQLRRADVEIPSQPVSSKSKGEPQKEQPALVQEPEAEKKPIVQREKPEPKPQLKINRKVTILLVGLTGTIVAALFGSRYIAQVFSPEVTSTPTLTVTPSSTPTEIFTPSPTSIPLPGEITDEQGVPMVLIPAGMFTMGNDDGSADAKPAHQVYLSAFYIDKYELTNTLYEMCVASGACAAPRYSNSNGRTHYYGSLAFDHHPVIYVDWEMAKTYCETWRGTRLPTEAEWEKAARGSDGLIYPWGDEIDQTFANYDQNRADTTAVGSYETGKSVYGVYDMAGNVWEWVSDWYDESYYSTLSDSAENPSGPVTGINRVLRGGSWNNDDASVRSNVRSSLEPTSIGDNIGFRCARDAAP